ncbi:putative RNase H [Trypanosoma cruzi]|uniref:Putative RNase H n=1 Tax=Trypanosoma cruzi TaxID=5693 RepID=A0A2V2VZL5_TRYCR|nr:putative RNase H [Trypanosoma cruzi]
MIPRIRHRHKTLLVVTDSQSLLAALNKGPLSQTDWTEDQIWQRLLTLTCAGWSVHLQFCYGHCGVHANELADQHATQTMETGQYTEHGIAPLWHTDLLTCFTTQLTNKWRGTIRQDTHRYLLCGTRPSDLSGKDPTTQEVLHRQELVHLARARCGESAALGPTILGRERLARTNADSATSHRKQSAYMRSNNDPTAPGTDTVPPSAREEDVSPVRRRTLTRRRKEKCPHCDSNIDGILGSRQSLSVFHPEHLHRFPSSNVISVTWFSPHGEAPHSTEIAAHTTQTPLDIETAVPGGDLCCRRISQLPQARQLAAGNLAPSASRMSRHLGCASTAGH